MTDRNIVDLARATLEREERLSDYSYSIPLAAQASWDAIRSEQVKAAPTLARAVLRVAMLTDRLGDRRLGYQIRAILNGENR